MESLIRKTNQLRAKIKHFEETNPNAFYVDSYCRARIKLFNLEKEIESRQMLLRIQNQDYSLTDGEIDLYLDYSTKNINNAQKYFIYLHNTNIKIGNISYDGTFDVEPSPYGNIAYQINKPYNGHNYALKALTLLASKLYQEGIKTIYISAENTNIPSIVTIQKFGGIIREEFKDKYFSAFTCNLELILKKDSHSLPSTPHF